MDVQMNSDGKPKSDREITTNSTDFLDIMHKSEMFVTICLFDNESAKGTTKHWQHGCHEIMETITQRWDFGGHVTWRTMPAHAYGCDIWQGRRGWRWPRWRVPPWGREPRWHYDDQNDDEEDQPTTTKEPRLNDYGEDRGDDGGEESDDEVDDYDNDDHVTDDDDD